MRRLIALLVCMPLLLAACGGDGSDGGDSTSSSTDSSLPSVSGEVGAKPTIEMPEEDPPAELKTEVLEEGDGEEVESGDLLIAHYEGQIWRDGTTFDNSYERGEPAGFGIGNGQVIPGWDKGLVGQKVGSRVMLVIPPADGYGEAGNEQAGIKGDDTLVFVVDVIDHFSPDLAADGTVATELPDTIPAITNEVGKKPVITMEKGAKAPTEPVSAVLIEGKGEPLDLEKSLVVQVVQADYATGETSYETWGQSPLAIKASQLPGLQEALKGATEGSRVFLAIPAAGETPAAAVVLDVVGSF